MPTAVPATVPACAFSPEESVLCLQKSFQKTQKYKAKRCPNFCFESCSKSRNEHSA